MAQDPPPPRGLRTAYAFFIQHCRQKYEEEHGDTPTSFTEFMGACGRKWEEMPEAEKTQFEQLAQEDKVRYETELKNHPNPPKQLYTQCDRKHRLHANDDEPRRALSAFYWYCQDQRDVVKANLPNHFNIGNVSLELGRMWIAASKEVKAIYHAKARDDEDRYHTELYIFKNKKQNSACEES